MKPTVIENPALNSPFEGPRRHDRFDDDGITAPPDEPNAIRTACGSLYD